MGNRKKKDKKKALKHRFAPSEPLELSGTGPIVIHSPRGEAKMSKVLLDFIKPYEGTWTTDEQFEKLVVVAIVAWNAAIEGGEKGEELIQKTMATLPPNAQADFLTIVVALVERKLQFFAQNMRMIIDYQLVMAEDGEPRLSVVSTLGD